MRQNNKFVAQKIRLPFKLKRAVLSFGSQLKNTVCFANGRFAYLSCVHNDLNSPCDFLEFRKVADFFLKKHPDIFAVDRHQDYQSTKHALHISGNRKVVAIQHHHAHIASCMVENGLKNEKVIGVAFDGTGLGETGRIWGAEFLICDYKGFKRAAHLEEIPLIGGEKAIEEPWRLACAWLDKAKLKIPAYIDKKKWAILRKASLQKVNSPLASSMGRLFDAVASIIFSSPCADFEAQLAIRLENVACKAAGKPVAYGFKTVKKDSAYVLCPENIFRELMQDLNGKIDKRKIALNFHLTIAKMVLDTCLRLRKDTRIRKVVLSGGVFQNRILRSRAVELLKKEGFDVFMPIVLSPNDSCISLGQAVIVGGV